MLSMFQHVGSSSVEAEGFTVRLCDIPGQGRVPVVLVRRAPKGEYDLEISTSLDSIIKETSDAALKFRENQSLDKHSAMSSKIFAAADIAGNAKTYSDVTSPEPATPTSNFGISCLCLLVFIFGVCCHESGFA